MLAFTHIPKTAGLTVNRILRRSFGGAHCDVIPLASDSDVFTAADLRRLRSIYPVLRSIAGHRVFMRAGLEEAELDIQYFVMIRDPIHRAASNFQYHVQRMGFQGGFERWQTKDKYRNVITRHIGASSPLAQ
jgi:hypothetical protein